MTVSTENVTHSYFPGAGMQPEAIPFQFLEADDIIVTAGSSQAPLVAGTDFVISGDGRLNNGRVQALRAFDSDERITLLRATPMFQMAVTEPFKPLPSAEIGRELDRRAFIEQEIADKLSRAPIMPREGGLTGYLIALANGEWGYSVGSGAGGAGTYISWGVTATVDGQTEFDFSDMPDAFWQAMIAAPASVEFQMNGTTLEPGDYSWSPPTLTINDAYVKAGDVSTLKTGVAYDQGVVDVRNVLGLPAYIQSRFASRRANVLDIADWDATGTHDNATSYQELVYQAADNGVPLDMGAGKALLGSTITLPGGHIFEGLNCGAAFIDPLKATTFYIAHSDKGFIRNGGSSAPVHITNQVIMRDQPVPPSSGLWAPNDHDFDYYFADISDCKMRGILHMHSTRGLYINGGRNFISEWGGQCFNVGMQVDWSYDTLTVTDQHRWPYIMQQQSVREYMQDNLKSFWLKRVDNPMFSRIFSIWHKYGFFIEWFGGDGPNKPAGTTYKLKLAQADLDIGDYAYWVEATAYGHTADFSQVTAQGRNEVIASSLLTVEAAEVVITGDFSGNDSGGNVVRVDASAINSEVSLKVSAHNWNRAGVPGANFPAIEVEPGGGGHVDALPGSRFTNSNGGAVSSGDVTVWTP